MYLHRCALRGYVLCNNPHALHSSLCIENTTLLPRQESLSQNVYTPDTCKGMAWLESPFCATFVGTSVLLHSQVKYTFSSGFLQKTASKLDTKSSEKIELPFLLA
jgi:hypothetical protein